MRKVTSKGRVTKTDPGPYWTKSSLSYANGQCLEVADLPSGTVGVRDSKDAGGPILQFTPIEWKAFIGRAKNGEFDNFGRT